MPQTKPSTQAVAVLSFEIVPGADGIATEAHLLPPGPFRAADGRPHGAAWQMDAAIAARVIARQAQKKTDTLIDYEHQSLRAEMNGQRVPAAGWFNDLEWREGAGLYAVNVGWTTTAQQHIAAREYRYISAVFIYREATGEVLEIISVALTNTPALDGLDALADLAKRFSVVPNPDDFNPDRFNLEEANMADEKQVAALTVERDGLNTKLAALTLEVDGFKTQVAALTAERDTLKATADAAATEKATAALALEKTQHADLLQVALTDGRLTPAQKPWAEKQPLAALTEYLDASKPLPITSKQTVGQDAAAALSAEELAMCTRMGVSPEDFIKTRAATA